MTLVNTKSRHMMMNLFLIIAITTLWSTGHQSCSILLIAAIT